MRYDLGSFIDIWGDSPGCIVASDYAVFSNRKGNIYFTQRTVIDVITGAQLGIPEVEGGTGGYEGATGLLTWMPKGPGDGNY